MKSVTGITLALALLTLGACVSKTDYSAATQEVSNQDEVIRKLSEENERLRADNANLKNQYDLAQVELDRLRAASKIHDELGDLRNALKGLDSNVTINERGDGVALSVEGSVLFKTGSDDISDKGHEILMGIAEKVKSVPNYIRVEGHTDDVPVQKTLNKYPKGNLELSGKRALNVAHCLIHDGGLPAQRTCFAGYGEWRPTIENTSDENRQKNRRVEIVILNKM